MSRNQRIKSFSLLTFAFCLFLFAFNSTFAAEKIKVACVGNSITYGAGIKDRIRDNYPAQLGRMLGNEYVVKNFGVSARTLLSKGDYPYIKEKAYQDALAFNPDVVIIKLGTNDTKPHNWKFKTEYKKDYKNLIESFKKLESKPKVYLCKAVPVFKKSQWGIREAVVRDELNPLIEKIAQENEVGLIDLYTPMVGKADWFPDTVHPNVKGAGAMAKVIYKALTGKVGALVHQPYPGRKSKWHGFDRYDFDFYGRKAHLVVPDEAAPGNQWVWRARFPEWHCEMDSILLSEGFFCCLYKYR